MQKRFIKIMVLSLFVLIILVVETYRRGNIGIYQEKEAKDSRGQETVKKQKSNGDKHTSKAEGKTVRVLLSTTEFASLYHERVTVVGTKNITVKRGKETKKYVAGKQITFSKKDKEKGTIKISVEDKGRLQITSIKRQDRYPSYRGKLELTKKKQGFLIVNELPLEQYLYAVVPSELSTGNKMEALKAQAVCARSYAYNQISSGRFEQYNADLDDSVSCQVYNNIPEDKRSRKAVNSTAGKVVTRNGKVVVTYYYSTSWGKSASGKEVWETESEIPYLRSCIQTGNTEKKQAGVTDLDLSAENTFRSFLAKDTIATYDSESDWYRWNVTISAAALTNGMDVNLQECYQADASKILTQKKDGTYQSKPLKSIGKIRKLRIEKRTKSGLVTELVVVGTENVVKVCSQYNIRKVLSPSSAKIKYGGGNTVMTMLPSAAFYLDTVQDAGKTKFEIYGGGFGHGTGMSQCGAAQMAEKGKNYKEILGFYFSECEVSEKSIMR